MSSTILNLTQRSAIDGTEWAVLATTGANWKGSLGTQTWVFGGLTVNGDSSFNSSSAVTDTLLTVNGTISGGTLGVSISNFATANGSIASMFLATGVANAYAQFAANTGSGSPYLNIVSQSGMTGGIIFTTVAAVPITFQPNQNATAGQTMIQSSGGVSIGTASDPGAGLIYTNSANFIIRTKTSYTNGAGTGTGVTFTNAPGSSGATGNPTKWIPVDDNGTTRYIPAF